MRRALLVCLTVAACSNGAVTQPDASIFEIVSQRADLTTLTQLLEDADLESALSDRALRATLLAPSNAAFDAVDPELLAFIRLNPELLLRLLQYHVVTEVRPLGSFNLSQGEALPTLEGTDVFVAGTQPTIIRLQDAVGQLVDFVVPDVSAGLSVIHVVDRVLLPEVIEVPPGSIVEVLTAAGTFDTLLEAASTLHVGDTALASVLDAPGPTTLFAPTDDAFTDLGLDLSTLASDTDLGDVVTNILLAHVVPGSWDLQRIATRGVLRPLGGTALEFQVGSDQPPNPQPPTIGGAALRNPDVRADNGRVHVLGEVILPRRTLDVVTTTAALSRLAEIIVGDASVATRAGLAPEVFAGDRPITVFAPIDAALATAALPAEDLDRILQNHVLDGQLDAEDLTGRADGSQLQTLTGDVLTVRKGDDGSLRLADGRGQLVNVISTDLRALDGVIHFIDGVLFPSEEPPPDIVGALHRLTDDPSAELSFDRLLSAATVATVEATTVANVLGGPGPFTLFAPTDAAFDELGLDLTTVATNVHLQRVVANILLTHTASRSLSAADLEGLAAVPTLARTTIAVDSERTPTRVGGADLGLTDLVATNGRIHVVQAVIRPATVAQLIASTSTLTALDSAVESSSAIVQSALAPDVLSGDAPITVLAPRTRAFGEADLANEDLDDVLGFHVLEGIVTESDLRSATDGATFPTVFGDTVTVRQNGGSTLVEDARGNRVSFIRTDIRGLNGVVHVLDGVLLPPVDL